MARTPLDVWLYGTKVAVLTEHLDRMTMRWTAEATARWPINSTVISALLPITPTQPPSPARVRAYFAGLMPEGDARTELALEAGVDSSDVLGMLRTYGRDVAGALIIQPEGGEPPDEPGVLRPIDADKIAEKLDRAESNVAPLGVVPGITSISLAGMQPKIALRRGEDGQWFECLEGAASTHIIKPARPPESEISDLIWNEAFCLRVARRLGLTTVDAWVESFDDRDALVVSRYDRRTEGGLVQRIHQEDCAQLLGVNTDDPARKFQYGGRFPSLKAIAEIMDRELASVAPLLSLVTFNVAIGNTDAHVKNISMLHSAAGEMTLAPAYDVSPHRHYTSAGRRSALDVNGVQDIDAITAADLVTEAESWGVRHASATRLVVATLEQLRDALADVDDANRPGVPDAAINVMRARTEGLLVGAGKFA